MADNTNKTIVAGGLFAALLGGAALLMGKKTPKAGNSAPLAGPPRIRKGCNCGR